MTVGLLRNVRAERLRAAPSPYAPLQPACYVAGCGAEGRMAATCALRTCALPGRAV